jgi:AraC family transcriptional regulator
MIPKPIHPRRKHRARGLAAQRDSYSPCLGFGGGRSPRSIGPRSLPISNEKILPGTIRCSSERSGFQGVRIIVRELPDSAELGLPGGLDAFWLGYRPVKEPGKMIFKVDDPASPTHIAEHNPLFLIPGAPVRTEWRGAEGIVANFSFHPEFLRAIAESLKADFRLLYRRPARKIILDDGLESLCRLLMCEVEEGCKSGSIFLERVSRAFAISIVQHMLSQQMLGEGSYPDQRIERAIRFIEEHFRDNISVEELAQVAGLSPFHFLRVFRSTVGTSPHAYLVRRRLRHAQHLIRTAGSDRSLADIAAEAGFADQTHLISSPSKFGLSPLWQR